MEELERREFLVTGLVHMISTGYRPRPAEVYGNVELSVQAGEDQFSTPHEDGLPLDAYSDVECGLFLDGEWVTKPSDLIETQEFDSYWTDHKFNGNETWIGVHVPQEVVEKLRAALRKRAGQEVL